MAKPRRWRTTFGRWVLEYSVSRLATDLGARGQPVTPKAIYEWVAGRSVPHKQRVRAITELSGGTVTIHDIYRHYSDRVVERAATPRTATRPPTP